MQQCARSGRTFREMDSCYKNSEKIECVLEWNKGNHFQDVDVRCGKGFLWCMGENICKINNCKTNMGQNNVIIIKMDIGNKRSFY